jgi:hypothetical protein
MKYFTMLTAGISEAKLKLRILRKNLCEFIGNTLSLCVPNSAKAESPALSALPPQFFKTISCKSLY